MMASSEVKLRFSAYEAVWFGTFTLIGIVLSIIWGDTVVGFVAFISGILCVLLAAKGSRWNYVVGVVNCLTFSWVAWQVGLFGVVMSASCFVCSGTGQSRTFTVQSRTGNM